MILIDQIDDVFNKSVIRNTAKQVVHDYYNLKPQQKAYLDYYSDEFANKYEEMVSLILFNEAEKLGVAFNEVPESIINLFTNYHKFLMQCILEFDEKYKA